MASQKLSIKKVTEALMLHSGIILKTAEACGVTRKALYKFIEDHPELEEVREQARDCLLDVAEGHVASEVKRGEMKTTRWYLERMGRNRGYVTRVEETGKDGAPIEFGTVTRQVIDPTGGEGGE
ncbi:DNA-binding protein [Aminobacter phage Erebus]|nr:DNA-binding protein [Aminobacter phage Erebus]